MVSLVQLLPVHNETDWSEKTGLLLLGEKKPCSGHVISDSAKQMDGLVCEVYLNKS